MADVILIVEDDPFIALDIEGAVREEGFEVLGPAFTVAEAEALLAATTPDGAILDYNLGDETSARIARRLDEADVPFVYVTGRSEALVASEAPQARVLSKPIDPREVVRALSDA